MVLLKNPQVAETLKINVCTGTQNRFPNRKFQSMPPPRQCPKMFRNSIFSDRNGFRIPAGQES